MLKTTNFTTTELKNYYFNDETFFFTSNAVQELHFSQAQNQFYFLKVATIKNFCPRGRHHVMKADQANKFAESYGV